MRFLNWYFLFFIPVIIYLFFYKKEKLNLKFSSVKLLKMAGLKETRKHKVGKYLITAGLILLCIALARPQLLGKNIRLNREGIDIAMVLDVSESMNSVDFKPNRLEVARDTMDNFIQQRTEDRLSLIIFSGTAYTRIPLTLDHNVVRQSLEEVDTDSVSKDGTAIGMGIAIALNRLKKSEAKSKVVILITDGENNMGAVSPETATDLAHKMGVKIYTIGVGTDETILPLLRKYGKYKGAFDEELLKEIAAKTNGKYYRAKDPEALMGVFAEINQLEKTSFERDDFRQHIELAYILIQLGLILIFVGVFFDRYYYIRIP